MFDDLSKQQNNQQQENKSAQPVQDAPQQPVAPKEDVSQRIEKLREKGVKQGGRKKLYLIIGIAVILLFTGGVAGAGYFYWDDITNFLSSKDEEGVACRMDAKVCPDGSSVGRVPPDCEFAECPVVEEKDYYQVLEEKCVGSSCCLSSLKHMRENNYKEADKDYKCPDGFKAGGLKCESSLSWCEPIKEEEVVDEDEMDISNWQTYRNEDWGFEVKYPSNYKVGPRKNLIELEPNDYNKYCLIIIGQRLSFKNILFVDWHQKNMAGNQDLSIKEENKNQMVKTVEADGIQTLTNYTYFTNEKTAIYLTCNKNKDNSIYNQILSTFKFLQDTDNDGLFDDEEPQYGTDINNPDSDGDGYLDGDEVDAGYNPMGEGKL